MENPQAIILSALEDALNEINELDRTEDFDMASHIGEDATELVHEVKAHLEKAILTAEEF